MLNKQQLTSLKCILLCLCCQSYAVSGELDFGYDSRYVSEGRNNIEQGGIAWLQLSHELNSSISVVGLYGAGDNYDELNLGLVYSQTYADIDYYVSLTRLEFFQDNASDNELGIGAAYSFEQLFTLAVDSTYSTESNGAFVEFSLISDVAINSDLTFSPYIKAGLDFGYASDNKKAYNHTSLGASVNYSHSAELGLYLVVEHAVAGSQVRSETNEHNLDWIGLHLVYTY